MRWERIRVSARETFAYAKSAPVTAFTTVPAIVNLSGGEEFSCGAAAGF